MFYFLHYYFCDLHCFVLFFKGAVQKTYFDWNYPILKKQDCFFWIVSNNHEGNFDGIVDEEIPEIKY